MFHLIIYTEENANKIEKFLTLFENLYDCSGSKIPKKCNDKNNFENYDCKDNSLLKEKIEDKKLKEKELIDYKYELCIRKYKIQYYTCNFLQLYINNENNFDLYLIDEDETPSLNDNLSDNKNIKLKKNEEKRIEEKKDKENEEDSISSLDKKFIDVNLPLQRSHILFILSFPIDFSFYDFFSLIHEYIDFIVFVKIFDVKSNFNFLKKKCYSKNSFSKVQKKYVDKYKNKKNNEKVKEEKEHIYKNYIHKNSNEFLNKPKKSLKKEQKNKNIQYSNELLENLSDNNKQKIQNDDNIIKNQINKQNKCTFNDKDCGKNNEIKKSKKIENNEYCEEKNTKELIKNINKKEKKKKNYNNRLFCTCEDNEVDYKEKNFKNENDKYSIYDKKNIGISLNIDSRNNSDEIRYDYIISSSSSLYSDYYSCDLLNKDDNELITNNILKKKKFLSSGIKFKKKKKKSSNSSNSNSLYVDKKKKNDLNKYLSSLLCKDELLLSYQKIYNMLKKNLKKKKKIECYSVLIIFKTQIHADMFYKKFHCKSIDFLMKSKFFEHNSYTVYENWHIYCVFVNLIYYIVDHKIKKEEKNLSCNINKITEIGESDNLQIKKNNNKLDNNNNKYKKDYKNNSKKNNLHEYNLNENNLHNNINENILKKNILNENIKSKDILSEQSKNEKHLNEKKIDENTLIKNNVTENNLREYNVAKKKYSLNIFDINNYENFLRNIIIDSNICISVCLMCIELLDNEVYFILTRNKKWNNLKKRKNYSDYINLSCNICTLIYFYDIISKVLNSSFYDNLRKKLSKEELIKVLENYLLKDDVKKFEEDKYLEKENEKEKKDTDEKSDLYYYIEKNTINKKYFLKKRDRMILNILKLNEIINMLKCKYCDNTDDIWLCLICSNIGCSRYQKGHAKVHSSKYNHNYCINLKTKKIWNYLQDTFIKEKMDKQSEESKFENSDFSFDYYYSQNYSNRDMKNNNIMYYDNEENFTEMQIFDDDLYEYNSHIYNKIFDIFTNDIYINDNLKNELLYILYSQLSHESNIYNNILIDIQYKYLNKLESKKKIIKNVHEKINEIINQNKKLENFIDDIENAIKIKNNEKTAIQDKIKFYRDLNNNIITQKKLEKTKIISIEDENDNKKIKRLNETIKNLQSQVDDLLINL
ncbi:ubiquitin carboxyl-terminal hydrolase, putative [Plasmodium gallinaceum]|uniref:Ubiquitin carboxyl-terminal hydrolase, putative n=1 Tax=Plasmodium gallinaceum TaxID=5849 RepID=A0A1J1GQ71_PLAGA|nr:ubiquitin carboxyl-terminal hydrolase, putative [Plasmodium gallinaceum]CRG94452.1 ubiquitin carboxyl-terminal hydrolase, putative [Plasmodium gallinaceum]